ncbi:GNAT family N-acetyltransferase [Streptacidiphilus rugosus]|uniref:GNAT family N-acetyltransferase n=1 Tax=Streptacidiphilus rugosus TaxID=405783 RepID=UPI0005643BBA|nr:GNAT family protein [Streptacidiphilus rugosus]
MDPVILETARLSLRQFTDADIDGIHAACQDPDTQRFTSVPVPYRREHAESFVREICPKGWAEETLLNFGCFRRDTGELVASTGFHGRQFRTDGVLEIGYWSVPSQRRQGFTAEAVAAMCDWAFDEVGVARIEWLAMVGNQGSRAVAEKVGFRFEGTLRSRLLQHGVRSDAWIGGLLSTDRAMRRD